MSRNLPSRRLHLLLDRWAEGRGDTVLVSSLSDDLTVVPQKLFRTFEDR